MTPKVLLNPYLLLFNVWLSLSCSLSPARPTFLLDSPAPSPMGPNRRCCLTTTQTTCSPVSQNAHVFPGFLFSSSSYRVKPGCEIRIETNQPALGPSLTVLPALLPTEATEEVSLDSPEREVLLSDGPSPAITPITPPTSVIAPRITIGHDDMFTHSSFDEVSGTTRH